MNSTDPGRYTHEGNRPEGPAPTRRATTVEQALLVIDESLRRAATAMGAALVAGFADGIAITPISEQARAYQHARMVAALTCPWLPPGPAGEYEVWLGSIVQEGGERADLL